MEEDTRMIDAARRKARRMARKSELTYQQCLDAVARELGREHWSAFAASPVAVPRDTPPERPAPDEGVLDKLVALALANRSEIVIDGPEDPHLADPDEFHRLVAAVRDRARIATTVAEIQVGVWRQESGGAVAHVSVTVSNRHLTIMAARASTYDVLSPGMVPTNPGERRAYLKDVADLMVGNGVRASWFDDRARGALAALLEVEVATAERDRRPADVRAMIDWIRTGFQDAGPNGLSDWFTRIADGITQGELDGAAEDLRSLAAMPAKERSDVLGTVDRSLLPFVGTARMSIMG